MFRIGRPDDGQIVGARYVIDLKAIMRPNEPGHQHVGERLFDPICGSKVSAWARGKVIHHTDRQFVLDLIPRQRLRPRFVMFSLTGESDSNSSPPSVNDVQQ